MRSLFIGGPGTANQRRILLLAASLAVLTATASDQLVADGQTNVLSGVTNNLYNGLAVGFSGSNTLLVLTNRANVNVDVSAPVCVGCSFSASNNQVVVGGSGTSLNADRGVNIGSGGSGNSALVTAGGLVSGIFGVYVGFDGQLGSDPGAQGNRITVTGSNSTWKIGGNLFVNGSSGTLLVEASGKFNCIWSGTGGYAYIGNLVGSDSNQVVVTGSNSVFTASDPVYVGNSGSYNSLIVTSNGSLTAGGVVVGYEAGSSNNQVTVSNGKISMNNTSFAALDVRRGSVVFNGGTIQANILRLTNSPGYFVHNGGVLSARITDVSNGRPFVVGDGTNTATISLIGSATNLHSFADGLLIQTNATLTGTGTIIGNVTNFGTIAPGNSAGALAINGSLSLRPGANLAFELGGLIATNDHDVLNVTSLVEFAGTFSVAFTNGFTPAWSNRFTLMSYASGTGAFTNVASGGRLAVGPSGATLRMFYNNGTLRLSDYRLDLDGDGLDDAWANFYFGHTPLTAAEKSADADGDGQSNFDEYLAGTDPLDATSCLCILTIAKNGAGENVIQFTADVDKAYALEWSDNNLASWNTNAAPTLTFPSPAVAQWVDDGTQTGGLPVSQRYYRVGLQ